MGRQLERRKGRSFKGLLLSAEGGWRVPSSTGVTRKQVQATQSTSGRKHGIHFRPWAAQVQEPPILVSSRPAPCPRQTQQNAPSGQPGAFANAVGFWEIFFANKPEKQNNTEWREEGQKNILGPLVSGFLSCRRARRPLPRTEG